MIDTNEGDRPCYYYALWLKDYMWCIYGNVITYGCWLEEFNMTKGGALYNGYRNGIFVWINGGCYGGLAGLYVELNGVGEGSTVHLIHVTQTNLKPVTLAILGFCFSLWWLLVLCDFWLWKKDTVQWSPSSKIFQVWFLHFPSMMAPMCYDSIFSLEWLEVYVFLKFCFNRVSMSCLWFLLWIL